jgi:hypothetical protein
MTPPPFTGWHHSACTSARLHGGEIGICSLVSRNITWHQNVVNAVPRKLAEGSSDGWNKSRATVLKKLMTSADATPWICVIKGIFRAEQMRSQAPLGKSSTSGKIWNDCANLTVTL